MRNDPFWVRVVADPRLTAAAREAAPDFLSEGTALFSSHYFCKARGAAGLRRDKGSQKETP